MQEDKEWHTRRLTGIGSSDAPIIMGVSPFMTRYELWLEKTGRGASRADTWATDKGKEMEKIARANYELEHNVDMPPREMVHSRLPYLRANLDGFGNGIVLEIKCDGREDHQLALMGMVPEKYFPQVQHQMFVSGALKAHYYSFHAGKGALVEVPRDYEYIKTKLLPALDSFWKMVENNIEPPLSADDYKDINSGPDGTLAALVSNWINSKARFEKAKREEKEAREAVIERLTTNGDPHPKWRYLDTTISKTVRKGNVDYNKIPALKEVDLEQFRDKGTEYWTFRNGGKE